MCYSAQIEADYDKLVHEWVRPYYDHQLAT
jgi:hypothetical protein